MVHILLFSLFFMLNGMSSVLGMEQNPKKHKIEQTSFEDSLHINVVEEQTNGWECGYRAVFNAYLYIKNNDSIELIDFLNPTPTFKAWIILMKQRWESIFKDTPRAFMNGKYDKQGKNTVEQWKNKSSNNQQWLESDDIKLLALLALDTRDNAEQNVRDFVIYKENNTQQGKAFDLLDISTLGPQDYEKESEWPINTCTHQTIARFKYENKRQIIFLIEDCHWTTMILSSDKSTYSFDSLNLEYRPINKIVYAFFVLNPFPTQENLKTFFEECKILKQERNQNPEQYHEQAKSVIETTLKKNMMLQHIIRHFKSHDLPIPEEFNVSKPKIKKKRKRNTKKVIDLVDEKRKIILRSPEKVVIDLLDEN